MTQCNSLNVKFSISKFYKDHRKSNKGGLEFLSDT